MSVRDYSSAVSNVFEGETSSGLAAELLRFVLDSQNGDGGWGYRSAAASRVEATSWAVAALLNLPGDPGLAAARRGADWLRQAQLPDGLWPSHPGMGGATWATSSACLALIRAGESSDAIARGASALCQFRPREGGGLWWRIESRLLHPTRNVTQDFSLHGWSWIPGTVSWVIPTALALIFLQNIPEGSRPKDARKRMEVAEAMLFDRTCPGGGWNIGNPMVYGVGGVPLHEPTAWALLALHHRAERPEVQRSLAWLESAYLESRGALSFSLGHMCLRTYGRPAPPLEPELGRCWAADRFLENISTAALGVMALLPDAERSLWYQGGINQ
ncbi:MAG: hypothetical protein WA002_14700 [Candidatus Acidiferrales bacterium]